MIEGLTNSTHTSSTDLDAESETDNGSSSNEKVEDRSKYEGLGTRNGVVRIRETYDAVRTTARAAEEIVVRIVQSYSDELDSYVNSISEMLDDIRDENRKDFSDLELQRITIRLPILMYGMIDAMDRAAIESDVSKAMLASLEATNYLNAEGRTIPERRAYATMKTATEATVVDLTRHVYQRLKNKFETASSVFDGIRKVVSMRDTEKSVFGRSK